MLSAVPRAASIVNALSFDIEDWFHLVEVAAVDDRERWPRFPSIVEERTAWILDTLAASGVRATFFFLGWIAQEYPRLVGRVAAAGHEIGTHSHWHRRVDRLTAAEFREDLRTSIDAIQQASGAKVLGFRAPSFSITPGAEWAFDILLEAGLQYDASLFPAPRGHGGYPCARRPHLFSGAHSGRPMPELPVSVVGFGPLKLAFSGGGYLRALPFWFIDRAFVNCHRRGLPVVVYLHPRDFAPGAPRVPMPPHRRFKSYVGLKTTERKLLRLLQSYRFDTCAAVLNAEGVLAESESGSRPSQDSITSRSRRR